MAVHKIYCTVDNLFEKMLNYEMGKRRGVVPEGMNVFFKVLDQRSYETAMELSGEISDDDEEEEPYCVLEERELWERLKKLRKTDRFLPLNGKKKRSRKHKQ